MGDRLWGKEMRISMGALIEFFCEVCDVNPLLHSS
jgi:hypothetical protein